MKITEKVYIHTILHSIEIQNKTWARNGGTDTRQKLI